MKKASLMIGALIMIIAILFSGCNNNPATPGDTDENISSDTNGGNLAGTDNDSDEELKTDTPEDSATDSSPESDNEPYTLRANYMPEKVSSTLKDLFENRKTEFLTASMANSPFVIRDVHTVSNCRLVSITIPVLKTLAADKDGNFQFTLTVGSNGWYQIQDKPAATYRVLINGAEANLSENESNIYKWLKVDVSKYNIVLSEAQTLGWGSITDTIIPAYLGNGDASNPAQELIETDFPQMRGFVSKMGKGMPVGTSQRTLLFDFEWERDYESRKVYLEEVAAEEVADAE